MRIESTPSRCRPCLEARGDPGEGQDLVRTIENEHLDHSEKTYAH